MTEVLLTAREWSEPRDARPPTWIYFVLDEPTAIKIGVAADPIARLKNLQVASPRQLYLLGAYRADPVEEKEIHDRFAEHRIRGEWYEPAPELVEYIADLCRFSGWEHGMVKA